MNSAREDKTFLLILLFLVVYSGVVIYGLVHFAMKAKPAFDYLSQHGVKAIVERVWEGKKVEA